MKWNFVKANVVKGDAMDEENGWYVDKRRSLFECAIALGMS